MSAAIAEQSDAPEITTVPPGERQAINKMAEKLTAAMARIPERPAAIAPVIPKPTEQSKPVEKPVETSKPVVPEKPAVEPAKPVVPEKPAEQSKPESKTRQEWKELVALKDKYQAEAESLKPTVVERDQLKAELETARKGSTEYEEAKKKLAVQDQAITERDQFIKQFYIEHSPEFQSHFGQRLQNAILAAKRAVGAEAASKIETVFQVPASKYRDEQVALLAEGLSEFDKGRLVKAYTDLEDTELERAAELKKAPENFKKLQELQAQRAKEAQEQETAKRDALTTMVMSRVESELKDADEVTAKTVKERTRKVIEWSATPEELTGTLVDAARASASDNRIKEYIEKVGKLEAQLQELQGAQPGVQTSAAAPMIKRASKNPADDEPLGLVFRREMQKRGNPKGE